MNQRFTSLILNKPFPSFFFTSVSKRVQVHNLSYGSEFFLHDHCLANQTHFHTKGCASGLVLKQRQKSNLEMAYSSST